MEYKTKVNATENTQEILIRREFNLPVDLLYRAYTEAEFLEQWMGTYVLLLEAKQHGAYRFQTTDKDGHVLFQCHGVFHDVMPNQKIIRTFAMEHVPAEPQLEFLEFWPISESSSLLTIQMIYRSVAARDYTMKLPFAMGLNMAHDRLEKICSAKIH